MNILLWILQALLGAAFLAHGLLLLFPPANMVELMNSTMGVALRVVVGVAEVLGGVGLVVPGITRIMPRLIAWAAAGLMIIMIGATVFHIRRGENSSAVTTAVLLAMLTVVAYMRWKVKPILQRTPA